MFRKLRNSSPPLDPNPATKPSFFSLRPSRACTAPFGGLQLLELSDGLLRGLALRRRGLGVGQDLLGLVGVDLARVHRVLEVAGPLADAVEPHAGVPAAAEAAADAAAEPATAAAGRHGRGAAGDRRTAQRDRLRRRLAGRPGRHRTARHRRPPPPAQSARPRPAATARGRGRSTPRPPSRRSAAPGRCPCSPPTRTAPGPSRRCRRTGRPSSGSCTILFIVFSRHAVSCFSSPPALPLSSASTRLARNVSMNGPILLCSWVLRTSVTYRSSALAFSTRAKTNCSPFCTASL